MKLTTPGFWDLHIHGVAGIDFISAPEEALFKACQKLGNQGIAFFAPTLLTCPEKMLVESCSRWGSFLEKTKKPNYLPKAFAKPIGLHLEGPFLSPARAGAHKPSALRKPSLALFQKFYHAAQGHVRILTLAPELPQAIPLIRKATSLGVRVQLGHTQASPQQLQAALKAGAQGFTHLWNAMHIHHRSPGALEQLVFSKHTQTELITDGEHIHPALCWHVLRSFQGQAYGVSDACPALGCADGTVTTMGPIPVQRKGATAIVKGKPQTLAGGATWLTQHPERLWRALPKQMRTPKNARMLLSAFYKLQQQAFSKFVKNSPQQKIKNHFDVQTLSYLATQS